MIFGGLGQDDLIGGSSSLYSLTTPGPAARRRRHDLRRRRHRLVRNDFGDIGRTATPATPT